MNSLFRQFKVHFYKEDSHQKEEFAKGIEGEKIVITGKVINFFTCKPISGAVLDFWQADSNGKYDIVGFNLRGKVISDEKEIICLRL